MTQKTAKFAIYFFCFALFAGSMALASAAAPKSGQGTGLVYSTFVGTTSWDGAEAITVDDDGRAYVVGYTEATMGFPGEGSASPTEAHEVNAVVTRLNAAGTAVEYSFYFNPDPKNVELEDFAYDVAVDSSGSAYIVGQTQKVDFCSFMGTFPGYDTTHNGDFDVFVIKIKPDGSGLDYCTFIGGSEWDTAYAMELDANNNVFLAGYTWSENFPATSGAYDESINGARDIFVAKLSASGTVLEYATYMGGSGQETANGLTLDSQNNAYVTGWTTSSDLPTPGTVLDDVFNGPFDGFVFKLNSNGSNLIFNTYLGGTDEDRGQDIVLDNQGNIRVVGNTRSEDFPVTGGAMDTTFGGGVCFFMNCADGFAVQLNPTATALDYATFIGGDNEEVVHDAFPHPDGGLYVAGESISETGFPITASAYDPTPNGEGDGFLTLLNAAGSGLEYGTFLGSTDVDRGAAMWADSQGQVYMAGLTLSTDFPTVAGSYDTEHNGDYDIFVSKLQLPAILKSFVPAVFR